MGEQNDTDMEAIDDVEGTDEGDSFDALMREVAGVGEAPIPPDAPFSEGTMVTDRVRLVEVLGRGGMGSVWVADHLTLERRVAVKFINRPDRPEALERFSREAKLAAKLDSPHAVRIFDHGLMEGGVPFIVMELLDGESLAQRLDRDGCLPNPHVVLLVKQVAQVLEEAHALGIVHRDIKPANLLLTDSAYDLFAKVLDFGVAKQPGAVASLAVTGSGVLVGTPLYMAPEQLLEREPADDVQADLWGLAVVAYEALTGRCPFAGDTVAAIGASLSKRHIEDPAALRSGLPGTLLVWFECAFARDPAARFNSATELAESFAATMKNAGDMHAMPGRASVATENAVTETVDPVATTALSGRAASEVHPEKTMPAWVLLALAGVVITVAIARFFGGTDDKPTSSPVVQPAASPATATASATQRAVSTAPAQQSAASAPDPLPPSTTAVAPSRSEGTAPSLRSPVLAPANPTPTPSSTAPPQPSTGAQAPPVNPPIPGKPEPTQKGGIIQDAPF